MVELIGGWTDDCGLIVSSRSLWYFRASTHRPICDSTFMESCLWSTCVEWCRFVLVNSSSHQRVNATLLLFVVRCCCSLFGLLDAVVALIVGWLCIWFATKKKKEKENTIIVHLPVVVVMNKSIHPYISPSIAPSQPKPHQISHFTPKQQLLQGLLLKLKIII